MREKYKENLIYFFIIFTFGLFTFFLYKRNQLPLYIHPRYITPTMISSILAIAVGLAGVLVNISNFRKAQPNNSHEHEHKFNFKNVWSLILVLSFCLLVPAKSLTSATASQRNIDVNSIGKTSDVRNENTVFSNFSVDTEQYSIGDWVSISRDSTDLNSFVDKKAVVSGFVFKPQELPNEIFMVARFVVTCCAVDARPVGLNVKADIKDIKENDWIEVNGKFNLENINGKQALVLIPDEINKISKPTNQYLF